MPKRLARLALVLILVSLACNMPVLTSQTTPEAAPLKVSALMVTAGVNSTATPTPFQPIGPTITPTITQTPTPEPTLEPTDLAIEGKLTPVYISQNLPPGTINFLVLGNDFRPNSGFRTDVIMLVSVHTGSGTVSVVSFPRDLYVNIPGWTTQRINTAFQHGGFQLMADTFQANFGVRPKFYVMSNFEGFVGIVNGMGGIKVNVGKYLSDSCDIPMSVAGRCTVYPGTMKMDGQTALWYVRSRHSTSDIDRTRRAQEVLFGMFNGFMSRDVITRLPDLYNSVRSSVDTNIRLEDIAPLLPVAVQIMGDSGRVKRYTLGPGYVSDYITPGGAMVLLPNYYAIKQLLTEALLDR